MKKLLTILCFLICANSFATTFYFSNAGNDANAGTIGAPWATIAKFNSVFASKAPGDQFLFNRGNVFVGTLIISRSGSAGLPITIGAYGSGAAPIITGFTSVTAWTNLGANIWESTSAISTRPNCNMVTISGVNIAMGRFPNSGWLTAQTFSSTTLSSTSLNTTVTNWTGANVVVRKERYVINHNLITSASGSTLTYAADGYAGHPGWGFFIQNDVRTLDAQNEWYYSPTTKKIRIYSTSSPTSVNVATSDTLVYMAFRSYITFDGVSFTGCNTNAFRHVASNHITVQNCNFDFNYNAILGEHQASANSSTLNVYSNNTINHSQNNAIQIVSTDFSNITITNNLIKNSGIIVGMAGSGEGQAQGMNVGSLNNSVGLIQSNEIDSTGYIPIGYQGNSYTIEKNLVNYFNLVKDDGGGIYTGNDHTNNIIQYNTVLNGIGNGSGTTDPNPATYGIYLDGNSTSGISVLYNTVANYGAADGKAAYFFHNPHDIIFKYNTAYNYRYCQWMISNDQATLVTNMTVKGNIFFAKPASQFCIELYTVHNDIPSWQLSSGSIDSNYYARPIADNLTVNTKYGSILTNRSVAMWQAFCLYDVHANKSPITITNVNQLDYQYNHTAGAVAKALSPGVWKDVRNVSYSGTITLQPYTSAVLMNTGAVNAAPSANAGVDQTIQLPTSSVSLAGSGSDPEGGAITYLWSIVSGSGTITTPGAASTTVTGLTGGVTQVKLTTSDNLGAQGSDIMQITVNPANVSPTANAGTDQAIQLPTSITTLVGSGSDPDGSITAYLWTKLSGPAGGTITSATSATTGITALGTGTYVFNLRVTDNGTPGLTGNDQITVIVSASANVAPTAAAGIDQTIQLPITSANLVGSGNDPDGTIASYQWTIVAGTGTITSPTSASTTVTGLSIAGITQLKLTVTDNGGLTGSDNIIITVTPANVPPLINAGPDQSITAPTSVVTLSGSATDPDGTISSHTWTKISGTGGTITTAANYTTTVTGLVPDTYVFRLTATDNQSLTGFDEVTILVNPAININPTADAGINQTLTWPTNTTTVSASGSSDPDGTIVSYLWSKISGPATYGILGAGSVTATINGLDIGAYQFAIKVTDNSGGTASDTIGITQNQGSGSLIFYAPSLTTTFNNLPQQPTLITTPAGLSTSLTIGGVAGGKIDAGTYPAIGNINDPHWVSTPVSASFVINKATVAITAASDTFFYDGLPHTIAATAPVPGLTHAYSGGSAPSAIGVTTDTIRLVNINYQASQVIVTITIVANPAPIFISNNFFTYDGFAHSVTVTCPYSYSVTGGTRTAAGSQQVIVNINDGIHVGTDTAILTIAKQSAVLSWIQPGNMPDGSLLSALQLSATSNIAGRWSYDHVLGERLPPGPTLVTGTFVPSDPANYLGGSISRTINVYEVNRYFKFILIGPSGRLIFIKQ